MCVLLCVYKSVFIIGICAYMWILKCVTNLSILFFFSADVAIATAAATASIQS